MKKWSIRTKITLLFTVALTLMATLSCLIVFSVSHQVIQKTVRDNLIENVERNVDEIEYYETLDEIQPDPDFTNHVDLLFPYKSGFLEVDDDFLKQINGVFTSLYNQDQELIYGENPIAIASQSVEFKNSVIQTVNADHTKYYIFDRMLKTGSQDLWLRGVVSKDQGHAELSSITRLSLILMPLLILLSVLISYLFSGQILKPIRQITNTALHISTGNDLKQRIELNRGEDELHQLADQFNHMFQRLDQAFETEQQFTSDASHELRTPMSVILAQCELSLSAPETSVSSRTAFLTIQRQGKRMSRLINDMLDYTRLEMRPDRYPKQNVDLSALTTSLCDDMALIRQQGIQLTADIQPEINIYGNPQLLSRLVTNLISNAYRYGKENGHILVRLHSNDTGASERRSLSLSVEDDGIGISKEEQKHIFQRFYQVDPSRSGAGTGLGLSMVQQIAEFHNGTVTVKSAPGDGSIFTVLMFL